MKKLIALLLVLCAVLSLGACGAKSQKKENDKIMSDETMGAEQEEYAPDDLRPDEDYLLTVELTPDNFDDYFECVVLPTLDESGNPDYLDYSSGERKYSYVMGLKSKKYDDGYVIYDMDNSDNCSFEYELWATDNDELIKEGSSELWRALEFVTGEYDIIFDTTHCITSASQYKMKLVDCGGTVTFVKPQYIVNVEKTERSDKRWGYPEYDYSYDLKDNGSSKPHISGFSVIVFSDYAH